MDTTKINELSNLLQSLTFYNALQPIHPSIASNISVGIEIVAQQISSINASISNRLIGLRNALFIEKTYQCFCVNQIVYGQILEAVEFTKAQILNANQSNDSGVCPLLHPDIRKVSEKLYRDGSYAEAAFNAFVEINSRIKKLYCAKYSDPPKVPDGQALMLKVFADTDPVLVAGDLTTQTGRDIQSGTRFLFAGAIAALRNPKAHENMEIEKGDSMRQLIFASMLMFQIDAIIATSENDMFQIDAIIATSENNS